MAEDNAEEQEQEQPQNSAAPLSANRAFVIGLLYIIGPAAGITGLVGLVLAYIYRGGECEPWEESHFTYLINTFWLAFVPSVVAFASAITLAITTESPFFVFGLFVIVLAVFVHSMVRTVLSLVRSYERQPMPNAHSWLI